MDEEHEDMAEGLTGETLPEPTDDLAEPAEPDDGGAPDAPAPVSPEAEPEPEPEPEPEAEPEPEPEAEPEPEPEAEPEPVIPALASARRVPWWPFLGYLAAWAVLVGASVYLLGGPRLSTPATEQAFYPYLVLAGLALTALGPVFALTIWLVIRARTASGERSGQFVTAFVRGSVVTLLGVVSWWATLVVLDALRLDLISF